MTTFERLLKVLDSIGAVIFILSGAIILAAYLFPEFREGILSAGTFASCFIVLVVLAATKGFGSTTVTLERENPKHHR